MKTLLTFASILSSLCLFGQTFTVGADYFPLNKKATYFYKAILSDENEVLQKFVVEEALGKNGFKYFYLENINNPDLVYPSAFGLGSYVNIDNNIYTIWTFLKMDLSNVDPEKKKLLLPSSMNINQSVNYFNSFGDSYFIQLIGQEKITVPAGEFDCLKLKTTKNYESGKVGEEVIWLAKDIGVIKYQRETGRTDELVKFYKKNGDKKPDPVIALKKAPKKETNVEVQTAKAEAIKTIEQPNLKDFEGNTYKTVQIGNQVWMAENLRSTKYANGEPIVDSIGNNEKYIADTKTFGRLFSWNAVINGVPLEGTQGVCPNGWHVPMKVEWEQLFSFVGGPEIAANKLKSKGNQYYKTPNTGTDEYGFNAQANPTYNKTYGYSSAYHYAHFWSSTIDNQFASPNEYCVGFYYELWHDSDKVTEMFNMPNVYHPVRCIKD